MVSSDDDGGVGSSSSANRDERRERRRQRVHDRLGSLIEENRMLTILTQEDADEIQKLRFEAEVLEMEKRRLSTLTEQQDTVIKQLQDQVFHLEHCKFVADVQAKTIDQQDHNIKELVNENKLLNAQVQLDAETIRTLHVQLNEVVLERDRLATRVGMAVQRREEAEAESKMLLEHAHELRDSNGMLAKRVTELEERVLQFEAEDYADFFTRVSKRDIANGQLMPSEAQFLLVRRKGTPPEERQLSLLAREAGVSKENMRVAEQSMPQPVLLSEVLHAAQAGGKSGIMNLSPEQLRILGASSASPSPKRFSAQALQLQFGISPEKVVTTKRAASKEEADLTQRKTELPLPKSAVQVAVNTQSSSEQAERSRGNTVQEDTRIMEDEESRSPAVAPATNHHHHQEDHVGGEKSGGERTDGYRRDSSLPRLVVTPPSSSNLKTNTTMEESHQAAPSLSTNIPPRAAGKHHHTSSSAGHKKANAIVVRDALSGSIVASDTDANGNTLMIGADDDLVSGVSPSAMRNRVDDVEGDDSDSDTEVDSPNRTMERNSLLRERLEVQRAAQAAAHGIPLAMIQRLHQQQQSEVSSGKPSNNTTIPQYTKSGPGGGTFRTQKQLRAGSKLPALEPVGGGTHYPPEANGGSSILITSPTKPSGSSAAAQSVGSRKVLAPLSPPPTSAILFPVHDRPSTSPLVIEAIYGEKAGSRDDEEKMYLVKYVSVESEQWTGASNIDPNCEALKLWQRAKAKARFRQQQPAK